MLGGGHNRQFKHQTCFLHLSLVLPSFLPLSLSLSVSLKKVSTHTHTHAPLSQYFMLMCCTLKRCATPPMRHPETPRRNCGCMANCTYQIGCSFWVTFCSWSYVWCSNCSMTMTTTRQSHSCQPERLKNGVQSALDHTFGSLKSRTEKCM